MGNKLIKTQYEMPDLEIFEVSAFAVICGSPEPGENEDVVYEDW